MSKNFIFGPRSHKTKLVLCVGNNDNSCHFSVSMSIRYFPRFFFRWFVRLPVTSKVSKKMEDKFHKTNNDKSLNFLCVENEQHNLGKVKKFAAIAAVSRFDLTENRKWRMSRDHYIDELALSSGNFLFALIFIRKSNIQWAFRNWIHLIHLWQCLGFQRIAVKEKKKIFSCLCSFSLFLLLHLLEILFSPLQINWNSFFQLKMWAIQFGNNSVFVLIDHWIFNSVTAYMSGTKCKKVDLLCFSLSCLSFSLSFFLFFSLFLSILLVRFWFLWPANGIIIHMRIFAQFSLFIKDRRES